MADDLTTREALERIYFIRAGISEVVYDSPDAFIDTSATVTLNSHIRLRQSFLKL